MYHERMAERVRESKTDRPWDRERERAKEIE
jgi:hypothetical protein